MFASLSESLTGFIQTPILGYIIALLTGILASMSPCVISTIPIAIGYVGGYGAGDTKKTIMCATAFVLGQTAVFVSLGALFGIIGSVIASAWWKVGLGALMIVMGLNVLGIFHIPMPAVSPKVQRGTGFIGGFLIGAMMATISTPCSTPALLAILAMGSESGKVVNSTILMVFYSLGQSTFVMAAAILAGRLPSILNKSGMAQIGQLLYKILGAVLALYGAQMVYTAISIM